MVGGQKTVDRHWSRVTMTTRTDEGDRFPDDRAGKLTDRSPPMLPGQEDVAEKLVRIFAAKEVGCSLRLTAACK